MAYCGTRFHGWQVQPNAISVQASLEQVLSQLHGETITVVGCGRTDTGVHASSFYAHFELETPRFTNEELKYKLNGVLPSDISVFKVFEVNTEMHARFSATSRAYKYFIRTEKDAFLKNRVWFCYKDLDIESMREAGKYLFDYIDFTSFSKLHTDVKTNDCTIHRFDIAKHENEIVITIAANRFLRNMVRAIVGTLVEVGVGKKSIVDFKHIIEKQDRSLAGSSAPADGLYLYDIIYPEGFDQV